MEKCTVCGHAFTKSQLITPPKEQPGTPLEHFSFHRQQDTLCSQSCVRHLQYLLGFTHGFLLCNVFFKLSLGGSNVTSVSDNGNLGDILNCMKRSGSVSDIPATNSSDEIESCEELSFSIDEKSELAQIAVKHKRTSPRTRNFQKPQGKVITGRNTLQDIKRKSVTDAVKCTRNSVHRQSKLKNAVSKVCQRKSNSNNTEKSNDNDAEDLLNNNSVPSENSTFSCTFCTKSFRTVGKLQQHHARSHPEDNLFSCKLCGAGYSKRKDLSRHTKNHHKNQEQLSLHCGECSKRFTSKAVLTQHKKFSHPQINPENCPECGLTVKSKAHLKRHLYRSHATGRICHVCGAQFRSSSGLKRHVLAHKGVKSYFCEVCGIGYVRKTSLNRHMQMHQGVNFSCDLCPASYHSGGALCNHMLQVHQRGSYFKNRLFTLEKLGYPLDKGAVDRHLKGQCTVCGENLQAGSCLQHPYQCTLSFRCHMCELVAVHVDDIILHLRSHSGNTGTEMTTSSSVNRQSYSCQLCHKVFPRKVYLTKHASVHHPGVAVSTIANSASLLTFVCKYCPKVFSRKSYLQIHMKQHLQPKSFACTICEKKFTYKCNLLSHQATHSASKPFQCDICFKFFKRKEVLASHKRTHNLTDSPYKCSLCGKAVTRKFNLQRHYKVMHPELSPQAAAELLDSISDCLPVNEHNLLPYTAQCVP